MFGLYHLPRSCKAFFKTGRLFSSDFFIITDTFIVSIGHWLESFLQPPTHNIIPIPPTLLEDTPLPKPIIHWYFSTMFFLWTECSECEYVILVHRTCYMQHQTPYIFLFHILPPVHYVSVLHSVVYQFVFTSYKSLYREIQLNTYINLT